MTTKSTLETKDIQALFKGFGLNWPKGRFYFCRFESGAAGRRLLQYLGAPTSFHQLRDKPDVCTNIAFTYAGLRALELNSTILNSLPDDFREGMRRRAEINGDAGESDPSHWDELWADHHIHLWIGFYAVDDQKLSDHLGNFEKWVEENPGVSVEGCQDVSRLVSTPDTPVFIDDPSSQPVKPVLLEHFGFRDSMGNPAIKGLADKHVVGGGGLDTEGNWHSLATGEFLLGHVDSNGEMPLAPKPAAFSFNGSFMVLRKLEQNVDLFRQYLEQQSETLDASADDIASRMVGRRRDGTPLMPADGDFDFRYASDPEGRVCPMGAHIRRTNPRDSFGAQFGSLLVDRHRILRRAITYGNLVPRGESQTDVNGSSGQGLMFIVLNASITRQFEFVQQQWVNYGNDFNQGNDRDPIIGLQTGDRQMVIPGDGSRNTMICDELKQFVTCRGGDYFFLPSVSAVRALANEASSWYPK